MAAPDGPPRAAPCFAAATGGTAVGHWQVTGLAPALSVRPGELAVLHNADAGTAAAALARGAAAVMTARAAPPLPPQVPQLRVASLAAALEALGMPLAQRSVVVGIAPGSAAAMAGDMLAIMLGRQMSVTRVPGPARPGRPIPQADVVLLALDGSLASMAAPDLVVACGESGALPGCRPVRVHRIGHRTAAEVEVAGVRLLIRLASAAPQALDAACAALAAVHALGADPALAALDLAGWRPGPGQGAHHRVVLDPLEDAALDLLDAAGPPEAAAFTAAFAHLAAVAPGRRGRRIAILTAPPPFDADLPAADVVHTVGPDAAILPGNLSVYRRGRHLPEVAAARPGLRRLLHPGDVVLVKGGPEAAGVVDALRKLGHRDRHATQEID